MKVYRYAVLAAILLACGLCWRLLPVTKTTDFRFPVSRTHRADAEPRKIYPYSVIVGGAYSGEELARARKIDRVVERHYAGFGSSTTVKRMPADTMMYVSYRKSNQIFWSKAKHRIPKGETVLCDGDNFARTRCGNRLSLTPQTPVAPSDSPTEEAMDIPDQPKAPLLASNPFSAPPLDADFYVPVSPADVSRLLSPILPDAPAFANAVVPGGSERPYNFGSSPGASPFANSLAYPVTGRTASNTFDGASTGNGTSPGSGTVISSPVDSIVTPEPGSLPLLAVGLLLSGILLRQVRLSQISSSRQR